MLITVSILNGSEHDLEASYERDLHLQEIDSFDFHSQSKFHTLINFSYSISLFSALMYFNLSN